MSTQDTLLIHGQRNRITVPRLMVRSDDTTQVWLYRSRFGWDIAIYLNEAVALGLSSGIVSFDYRLIASFLCQPYDPETITVSLQIRRIPRNNISLSRDARPEYMEVWRSNGMKCIEANGDRSFSPSTHRIEHLRQVPKG